MKQVDELMDEFIIKVVSDYCAGTLDKKTSLKLRRWIDAEEENRELFEACLKTAKISRMVFGVEHIKNEEAWNRLADKLHRNKRRRIRTGWSVAATLILLCTVALSLFFCLPEEEQPAEPIKIVRIEPGTTQATLELANGIQVDLTRNDLREIVEQNGSLIINDTACGLQYDQSQINRTEAPVFHTVSVPVGGEYHFILSDGSKVWINSESELKFPAIFTGNKREVFVKGEVYFEVEHQENPFVVHAGGADIKVLGTKFNVAAYPEENRILTTLAEGLVNVGFEKNEVLLKPGFQAVADRTLKNLEKNVVDVPMNIAWINGIFEYENMPLSAITTQLSRWYNVGFIFSAPEYKNRRFTGVVKKYDDLNEALTVIEKTTDVKFVINGKDIAVKSGVD